MKRIVTLTTFITLIIYAANSSAQLPELLYYKFDSPGTSVQNHALTPVGSNPATITGTGLSIGSTGLSGTALVGTGVSASNGVVNTGWLTNLSGSFTLAFWTSNISPSSTLWYIWGDAGASSLRCFTNGAAGANNWMLRGGGLPDLTITGGATTGSNMMHAVYDATTNQYRGYLNGVLVATVNVSGTVSMSGSGFTIGGYSSNSTLNGLMDEFRIYNRALSQTEITATYNTTLGAVTDLALPSLANISDSLCSGTDSVLVWMKNYGPYTLNSAKLGWKVNGVSQTVYNWSGNLLVSDSTLVGVGSYTFNTGTLYNVEVYVNEVNNGADTIDNSNDTVRKNNIFIKTTPTAMPDDTLVILCPGDSLLLTGTLTGSPPWEIIINDGTTNHTIGNLSVNTFSKVFYPNSTTTYSIISVTDATGCVNTTTPHVEVTVMPPPPATISAMGGPPACCQGDSIGLMASVGTNFSYMWMKDGVVIPGATNFVIYVKTGGNYTVEVTSPNGCKALSPPLTVTVHPAPYVFLGNDTAILPQFSILLDAGPGFNTYLWSTGATSQTLLVDSTGIGIGVKTIMVYVTDNYACKGGDTILINFTNHPATGDLLYEKSFTIYPNPSEGVFNLRTDGLQSGNYEIEIFSANGQLVFRNTESIGTDTKEIHLDLKHLEPGIYVMKLTGNQNHHLQKMVIEGN